MFEILGEAGKQEILQQVLRKFQISNRLPNRYFPKTDVGCLWKLLEYFIPLEIDEETKFSGVWRRYNERTERSLSSRTYQIDYRRTAIQNEKQIYSAS